VTSDTAVSIARFRPKRAALFEEGLVTVEAIDPDRTAGPETITNPLPR
jgi:hypothetical protein